MSNLDPATAPYVGIYDEHGKLLVVGLGQQEAFWRAQDLGFQVTPNHQQIPVNEGEYRRWWQELSPQQRTLLMQSGGSAPPAEPQL
jgi:hypothetical protein